MSNEILASGAVVNVNPLANASGVVEPVRASVDSDFESKVAMLMSVTGIDRASAAAIVRDPTKAAMRLKGGPSRADTSKRKMDRLAESGGASREAVWHKGSVQIPEGMTATEFITKNVTPFSFDVKIGAITSKDLFGLCEGWEDAGKFQIQRSPRLGEAANDEARILGYSGSRRAIIQPAEYASFADLVASKAGEGAYLESLCTWKGGAVFAFQIRLPNLVELPNNTQRNRYLTVTGSYDGTMALRFGVVDVVICCANTLAHANKEIDESGISLKQVGDVKERLEARVLTAKHGIASAIAAANMADRKMIALGKVQVTSSQFKELIASGRMAGFKLASAQEDVCSLFDGAGKLGDGNQGTAFGAYQALTEYSDWMSRERLGDADTKTTDEIRAIRSLYGSASIFKQASLDQLVQYFNVDFSDVALPDAATALAVIA